MNTKFIKDTLLVNTLIFAIVTVGLSIMTIDSLNDIISLTMESKPIGMNLLTFPIYAVLAFLFGGLFKQNLNSFDTMREIEINE